MAGSVTETERKRAASIQKIEEDRRKRVEEVKAVKAIKSAERAVAKEAQEAEAAREAARKVQLEALHEKRIVNIEKKEAAHKANAEALKERKLNKPQKSKYSEHDVRLLRQVFDDYDKDGSGAVSAAELKAALASTSIADSAKSMLKALDENHDGQVDFSELLRTLYPYANAQDMELMLGWGTPAPPPPAPAKHELSAEQLEEIGALFKLYDEDMSGGISTRELKDAMRRTFLTETHIDEIFAKADSDDDKQLTLAEFQALMGSTGLWDSP